MGNYLSGVFDPQAIKLNLNEKTKDMAFAELIDEITALNPDCNRDEILSSIKRREEKMSTGIGDGVAVPFVICGGINNISGALGVSQKGIDFGAIDNKPVHVIFMLAMLEQCEEKNLRVLKVISELAQSETVDLIKNAKTVNEIKDILYCIKIN
jgi:mannitol/fructose-specific phosphotransferase system IIA component (Ntr-type)